MLHVILHNHFSKLIRLLKRPMLNSDGSFKDKSAYEGNEFAEIFDAI
jgi:hypothetical protein